MENEIHDVSDTSIWVAYYRAKETERPDALFRDPLAKLLVGERGKKIAEHMPSIGRYTEWSVITRTLIIDEFIARAIRDGVDMIINLGAGLDTRPYRMNLPPTLRWIEVDYPQIISLKNERLRSEIPRCSLTRVELDLNGDEKRRHFLSVAGSQSRNTLILTEGVIPYLTESQVSALANDLYNQKGFTYWIAEYFSPEIYRNLQGTLRSSKMKNAPFRFYPTDWLGFFGSRGWRHVELRYSSEVGLAHGRQPPMPWYAFPLRFLASAAMKQRLRRMSGYVLFGR